MIVAHAPKTYFGSGDIQKSLGSLPGFPWAKYPGEKHLPGHNFTGPETKKSNTTAWINKAKPYFVDQIGDTLQGDLDMNNFKVTNLKSPENDNDAVHKKYLREQINSIEVKVDSIFFRQKLLSSNQFIARKVFQFINGTENVETKELEINDENSKNDHLNEIKTSGKYIDRFRMLITR
ncbi:hypothetical protein LOTGIDRAFT_163263 [Lottia gigantea]|uniref:Uncharacterized protein n=1 Tax=Lottia gigantea TaxID=225164 RepID=V3ZKP1_LOTGI|nr:hypothetical protein LOTGIDRAFT_163263 [Lottia gigantea]ESO91903.1 hypothetical protein LOTGIDRAFT_163263 [Lottia gigantea]